MLQLGVEVVVEVRVQLLFLVGGWWVMGEKKTKLMLYSTFVEIEVELGKSIAKRG